METYAMFRETWKREPGPIRVPVGPPAGSGA